MIQDNRLLVAGVAIVGACIVGAMFWMSSRLQALRAEVKSVNAEVSAARAEIDAIRAGASGAASHEDAADAPAESAPLMTEANAIAEMSRLKEGATAEDYARVAELIDNWIVRPSDESAVQARLEAVMPAFRAKVRAEVISLQDAALREKSSALSTEKLDEAGRRLAMYPMSDDAAVKAEAKALVDRQSKAVTRIDGLRRQRYNEWALLQVAQAMDYYNQHASTVNPFADNIHLMKPITDLIGVIDPQYLEPSVADLYSYVLEQTRGKLSDVQKVTLAKRLVDPAVERKSLGDF